MGTLKWKQIRRLDETKADDVIPAGLSFVLCSSFVNIATMLYFVDEETRNAFAQRLTMLTVEHQSRYGNWWLIRVTEPIRHVRSVLESFADVKEAQELKVAWLEDGSEADTPLKEYNVVVYKKRGGTVLYIFCPDEEIRDMVAEKLTASHILKLPFGARFMVSCTKERLAQALGVTLPTQQ